MKFTLLMCFWYIIEVRFYLLICLVEVPMMHYILVLEINLDKNYSNIYTSKMKISAESYKFTQILYILRHV